MNKLSSRKSSNPFIIGLFVIAAVIVMTGVVIWLGASQYFRENILYVTYFEGSVEGLEAGSPVKYLGVPVGSVERIKVAPDGRLVEVIMQIDKKLAINDSLRVKAELAGLAGGKFLQLYFPGNPEIAEMYPHPTFKPPYRVIHSSPSGIEEIEIAARDVINNLMKLKVGEISDGTVRFLNASSKFFESPELSDILSRLDNAGKSLNSILVRADTSNIVANLSMMGSMLKTASFSLLKFSDTLNNKMSELRLNEKIDRIIAVYDSAISQTTSNLSSISYRVNTTIGNLNILMNEMRLASAQLRKTLRGISENPTPIMFSEPPPPE